MPNPDIYAMPYVLNPVMTFYKDILDVVKKYVAHPMSPEDAWWYELSPLEKKKLRQAALKVHAASELFIGDLPQQFYLEDEVNVNVSVLQIQSLPR